MTRERTAVVDEALALERAGATWSYVHAAAITGYSVTALRSSDCPSHRERTPRGVRKDRIVFIPSEVRAWKAGLLVRST